MINALDLTKKLIRCKSITPEDDGAIETLANHLSPLGFECHILEFTESGIPPIKNLYAKFGTGTPNLCFAGHTDVVPIGNIKDWKHNPFGAEIENGILYGRGAVDMKTSIACFAQAAADYIAAQRFKGSISFLITGDEEVGTVNGTQKLLKWLEEKKEKLSACIVGEPTSENNLGEMIQNGRRGSISFALEVKGKQGHIAYPQNYDNPITRLANIIHELKSQPLDKGNEHFEPSNLEFTDLHVGNDATNVVPARANARFNIRFNNLHSWDSLTTHVNNTCTKHTQNFSLNTTKSGKAFFIKPNQFSDIIKESVHEVTQINPKLTTCGGTSDARFIQDYCPTIFECGLVFKTAHQVDEHVSLQDIENLTKIYYKIINKFFEKGSS
jgi:succinyl-diaminopimelate desuccinylase